MPQQTSMKERVDSPVFTSLLQVTVIASCSFIFFFFIVPNQPGRGGAALVCAIGGLTAARACWRLRRHAWFWITLVILLITQAGAVVLLPWPTARFPGIVLLPIGLADYALVYGSIKLIEHVFTRGE